MTVTILNKCGNVWIQGCFQMGGFFDMHGNVWEWVHDWKADYLSVATRSGGSGIGLVSGANGVVPGVDNTCPCVHLKHNARASTTPSRSPPQHYGFRVGFQAVQPDTANPELELFGGAAITSKLGMGTKAWAEPGVEAHDARDGNITDQIVVTGSVDMNSTGTYLLTYERAGCRRQSCHRHPHGHGGGQPHRGSECHRGDGYDLVSAGYLYHG